MFVTHQRRAAASITAVEQVTVLQKLEQQPKLDLDTMLTIPLQVCPTSECPHPPLQKIKAELVRINLDDMSRS